MDTCPTETDKTILQDNEMDAGSHDNSRTLFDSLPFVTTFVLGLACAFVIPLESWPLVAGLGVLAFIAGRRLERRLAEDRFTAFRDAVVTSPSITDHRPSAVSLTKETG